MKKTVNVNIAAQAFTLDEDAYKELESYLDDIASRLPASDTGSMDNIESRIARMFGAQVKAGRQIVSLASLDEVKDAIGRPESFGRRCREAASHVDALPHTAVEQVIEDAEVVSDRPSYAADVQPVRHAMPVQHSPQSSAVDGKEPVQAVAERPQSTLSTLSDAVQEQEQPYDYPTHLYRSREERMLAGVCGGLSKYLNYPVGTVRAVTVILVLPALLSVFAYFILWYLLPEEPLYDKNGNVIDTDKRVG